MAFRSDWKSADQLQADIDAGSIPPAHHLIIDLWRRVEELQSHIDELERKEKPAGVNRRVSSE
jgi:hypothetical protein